VREPKGSLFYLGEIMSVKLIPVKSKKLGLCYLVLKGSKRKEEEMQYYNHLIKVDVEEFKTIFLSHEYELNTAGYIWNITRGELTGYWEEV